MTKLQQTRHNQALKQGGSKAVEIAHEHKQRTKRTELKHPQGNHFT